MAKRLYRFLGKRFYYQSDFVFDLEEIAFERVGLSRTYADAYKIKEKLQPAIDELEAVGFLRPLGRDERYTRIERGQWTIRLTAGPLGKKPRPVRQFPPVLTMPDPPDIDRPADAPPTTPPPLVNELVNRGVTGTTAADLVRQYPADAIEAKLEVFDWLMEKQDKRVARSPAGYLVKSITDDYAAPKGFESRATRQARAEAKRQADREVAEGRRRRAGAGGPRPGDPGGSGRLAQADDPGRAEGAGSRGAGHGPTPRRVRATRRPRPGTAPSCCWACCGSTWRGSWGEGRSPPDDPGEPRSRSTGHGAVEWEGAQPGREMSKIRRRGTTDNGRYVRSL